MRERSGPLGDVWRALGESNVDAETALKMGLGAELAEKVIALAVRVKVRTVRGAEISEAGRPIPRTATVTVESHPIRGARHPFVRGLCRLLVTICGYLRPGAKRTGHRGEEGRIAVGALARYKGLRPDRSEGLSRRELGRWLTVLRVGGVLQSWQPPPGSGMPTGVHSGYCLAVYELAGGVPPTLAERIRRWWGKSAVLEHDPSIEASVRDVERRALTPAQQAFAARLLKSTDPPKG